VKVRREIGRVLGERAGPTLIVTAGIHGNEPAGVIAAQRVLAAVARDRVTIDGELIVLAGNVAAMALDRRYQVKDLNRVWTEEKVAAMRARDPGLDDAEDREQRELLGEIEAAIARARGPVFFVDFHTTSAAGYPFGIYDGDEQESFARAFPLPMIRGLSAALAGVLSSYVCSLGATALAVEGGQHADPATIDHLTATLTVAIAAAGLASDSALADHARWCAHLDAVRGDIPRAMKVVARYAITRDDAFVMTPGFANIARVKKGQLLARDTRGAIHAPTDGLVILPLYQGQGDDGFFFGREV
jgi:succinylglutamate desuccinylase